MKKTHAVAEAISPMAKKAMYLSHFTPSMMPPETLQAMLVQRGPLLQRTVDSVVHSVETTAKHHHLFVGPRGIGKTHLISLIHQRVSQNPAVQSKALIAWMREEEWGVTSFMELVLRILRTLDQAYPELGIDAQTQALYELSIAQAEEQATQILLQTLEDKTLVILLENLDDLFDQLKPTSQKQLRALIQNHPQFVLVATTPSLFTAITSQNSPFYGFFDIDPLEELSFEEVVELLEKIALERGDTSLATFIQSTEGRARIRAVHHLAEGNPRIYIIFAQFLTQEALDELVQAFMHTLDELTPYYQARMKELSGQQRKIVEYLVHYRGAATVKQIAKSCFITQQVCSAQLKQLREKRTVRSIERGRESYYELAEPLMRLCMEVKQQKGEPIGLFVSFLKIWYTKAELEVLLRDTKKATEQYLKYIERALSSSEGADLVANAVRTDFEKAIKNEALQVAGKILAELQSTSAATDRDWLVFGFMALQSAGGMSISMTESQSNTFVSAYERIFSKAKIPKKHVAPVVVALVELSYRLFLANSQNGMRMLKITMEVFLEHQVPVFIGILRAVMYASEKSESQKLWQQFSLDLIKQTVTVKSGHHHVKRIIRIMKVIEGLKENEKMTDSLLQLPREERLLVNLLLAKDMDFKLNYENQPSH